MPSTPKPLFASCRIAAVLSVACPVMVAALVGCSKSDSGVITSANSKFEVADDPTGGGAAPANSKPSSAATAGDAAPSTSAVAGDVGATGDAGAAGSGAPLAVKSETKGGVASGGGNAGTKSASKVGSAAATSSGGSEQPPAVAAEGLSGSEMDPATESMLKKLAELGQKEPKGANRDEMLADFRETQQARITLAAKLLKSNANRQARQMAVQATIESYTALEQLRTPNVRKRLREFCAELRKDKDPEISRLARQLLFGINVGEFASETPGAPEAQEIMSDLKELLSNEELDERSFVLASQASEVLSQRGGKEVAKEAFMLVANTFKGHPDARLAGQAQAMLEQSRLIEMEFNEKLSAASQGDAEAAQGVLEIFRTVFDDGTPGQRTFEAAVSAAEIFERVGQNGQAKGLLDLIDESLSKHEDKTLVKEVSARLDSARRRLSLLGQPFTVDGKLVDGSPLDWSAYQGKVVLVDFWATWCGPCLREFPNIRKNFEAYHEKGFEVVGISLDQNPADVTEFFSVQKLPWPTVLHGAPGTKNEGDELSLADRCGVTAIPFTVLIGRDGNVLAINVRGEALGKQLAKLLDEMEPAAGEEKAN